MIKQALLSLCIGVLHISRLQTKGGVGNPTSYQQTQPMSQDIPPASLGICQKQPTHPSFTKRHKSIKPFSLKCMFKLAQSCHFCQNPFAAAALQQCNCSRYTTVLPDPSTTIEQQDALVCSLCNTYYHAHPLLFRGC